MADDVKDIIMDLINKSDLFSLRIINPSEEDMAKIKKLYRLGFINSRTFTIPCGLQDSKVSFLIALDKKLEDLEWSISIFLVN